MQAAKRKAHTYGVLDQDVCMQDAYMRNPVLKSGLIFLVRFGNTFWGGAQWVWYAKFIGIQ